jgi:hypothetical protein
VVNGDTIADHPRKQISVSTERRILKRRDRALSKLVCAPSSAYEPGPGCRKAVWRREGESRVKPTTHPAISVAQAR